MLKRSIFTILILLPVLISAADAQNNTTDQNGILKAVLKADSRPLPLYGFNGNNTSGPSWANKIFRDAAASLHFKIIRYPGGTIADYWDWHKGWFVDDTPQSINDGLAVPSQYRKFHYSPTGLEKLKLLVDETHCDVVFTLNMLTRDLNDQIEMLKYAQSLGIPVKWIELGNEYNFMGSLGLKKYPTARDYGIACRQWIIAIKQIFPDVKVAVVGGDLKYSPLVRNWNEDVLNEAANADAIVAHLYPHPANVVDENGINFEKLFILFKKEFYRQKFDSVNKNIWVTEYNVLWGSVKNIPNGNIVLQYAFSWGQALSTILMTSEATDLPGVGPLFLDHNISGWSPFAAVETQKKTFRTLPNGIGMAAWCAASDNKTNLRQINFQRSDNNYANDFEVLGWQFSTTETDASTDLLVNFTPDPVQIDITALGANDKTSYDLKYADKNKTINSDSDVTVEKKDIKNNIIQLPAYSIATL